MSKSHLFIFALFLFSGVCSANSTRLELIDAFDINIMPGTSTFRRHYTGEVIADPVVVYFQGCAHVPALTLWVGPAAEPALWHRTTNLGNGEFIHRRGAWNDLKFDFHLPSHFGVFCRITLYRKAGAPIDPPQTPVGDPAGWDRRVAQSKLMVLRSSLLLMDVSFLKHDEYKGLGAFVKPLRSRIDVVQRAFEDKASFSALQLGHRLIEKAYEELRREYLKVHGQHLDSEIDEHWEKSMAPAMREFTEAMRAG